jgi:hypothetical protein
VHDVLAETQVMADKTTKGVTKRIDIRGMIEDISWKKGQMVLRLSAAQEGTLRPELVLEELRQRTGRFSWRAVRTALLAEGPNGPVDLLDRCKNF